MTWEPIAAATALRTQIALTAPDGATCLDGGTQACRVGTNQRVNRREHGSHRESLRVTVADRIITKTFF